MEISQITEGLISYSDLSIAGNADHAAASQSIRESHIWVGSSRDLQNLKNNFGPGQFLLDPKRTTCLFLNGKRQHRHLDYAAGWYSTKTTDR